MIVSIDMHTSKTCTRCQAHKPLEQFHKQPRGRHGRTAWCKPCVAETQREYRSRPEVRERMNEGHRRRRAERPVASVEIFRQRLWTWHRTTPEVYERLLEKQGGKCAICRTPDPGGKGRFHVDHDHNCCPTPKSCGNCIRGLLCSRCNPMLGMAQDSPETLLAAVRYLEG